MKKTRVSKTLSLLLAVCMVFTLLPTVAFAAGDAPVTGRLSIGGTDAVSDLRQDGSGTGWEWTAENGTLTLDSSYKGGYIIIWCAAAETVNLAFTGTVSIDAPTGEGYAAILCFGNLNISGSGTLALTSPAYVLNASGDLRITSGTVTATTTGDNDNGIFSQGGGITIGGDANVTGIGGYGIRTQNGPLTISTTGTVTAIGREYGIYGTTTTISSGRVSLNGSHEKPDNSGQTLITGGTVIYNDGTPPQITGISPDSGEQAGGTSLTITGTDLAGATVKIGGIAAVDVTATSATEITCTVPTGSVGKAHVLVETSGGAAALTDGFTYTEGDNTFFDDATFDLAHPPIGNASGGSGATAWSWVYAEQKITLTGAGPYTLTGKASGNMRVAANVAVDLTLSGAELTVNGGGDAFYLSRGGTVRVTADSGVTGCINAGGAFLDIVLSNDATLWVDQSSVFPTIAAWGLTLRGSGTVTATSTTGLGVLCVGDLAVAAGCTLSASGATGILFQDARTIRGGGNIIAAGSLYYGIGENGTGKDLTFDFAGNLEVSGKTYGIDMLVYNTTDTATARFTRAPANLTITGERGILGSSLLVDEGSGTVTLQNTANIPGLTAAFHAGDTVFRGVGSPSGGDTTPPTPTVPTVSGGTATATVTPMITNGTATASVTNAQISSAIDAAKAAAEKSGEKPRVEIAISGASGASSVAATIPQTSLQALASGGLDALTISSGLGSVIFDAASIATINAAATGDVAITAARVEVSSLPEAVRALVGDRPVYAFSVTSGGKAIPRFIGTATVSVPYVLGAGEDPNAVIVSYINADSRLEIVMNGRYDAATGMVVFTTTHFSQYAVGYNKVSFTDVARSAWYTDAVTFLAARGITSGTTAATFSPDATLTRGQFITLLLRAYGTSPDANPADNFSDAGNTYYTDYLAAAKRMGIASGVGGNKFMPEQAITRQEMFTLLYNTLKMTGALPTGDSGKTLADFTDSAKIASWASEAMTALVKHGTISGSGGKLDPNATTTRAQMAQVLLNLLGK